MTTTPPTPHIHRWLIKASWRATALKFHVRARTQEEAWEKGKNYILRKQGGTSCLEIVVLGTV